jgi:hypothetical protein
MPDATPETPEAMGVAQAPSDDAYECWHMNLNLLRAYVEELDDLPPAKNTIYRGVNLGGWVAAQRQAKKSGDSGMTPDQIAALESVPGWYWEATKDDVWEGNLGRLHAYVREYGHLPTKKHNIYLGVNLFIWVQTQRVSMAGSRAGRATGRMTPERAAALACVPGWRWRYNQNTTWKEKFKLLCKYVDKFNRLPKQGENYRGVALGRWVDNQRALFRRGVGRGMAPERFAALEGVPGWYW